MDLGAAPSSLSGEGVFPFLDSTISEAALLGVLARRVVDAVAGSSGFFSGVFCAVGGTDFFEVDALLLVTVYSSSISSTLLQQEWLLTGRTHVTSPVGFFARMDVLVLTGVDFSTEAKRASSPEGAAFAGVAERARPRVERRGSTNSGVASRGGASSTGVVC